MLIMLCSTVCVSSVDLSFALVLYMTDTLHVTRLFCEYIEHFIEIFS